MKRFCSALAVCLLTTGTASAECTFGEGSRLMMQAMQAFEALKARDPQRARQVEAQVQRMMANAPEMPSGRVPSDNSPMPEAMCDFWEDVLDLVDD